MKAVVGELIVIVIISMTLGIIYNMISAEPLSWIREEREIVYAEGKLGGEKSSEPVTEELPEEGIDSDHAALAVSFEQVMEVLNDPSVHFIDARKVEEYDMGHIEDAINIFAYDAEDHVEEIFQFPMEDTIIVYCGGGTCDLSHELAEFIKNLGYQKVFVYVGGSESSL